MAAINQITIAGGSTYDVNDKRITTSAVSTATHFLATDSSISSIAPITASNLASVLGVDPPISTVSLTPNQTFNVINVGNGKCRLIYLATTTGAVLYAATRRKSGVGNFTILSGSAIPELTITYTNSNDWFSISSTESIEVNYAILKMGR